VFTDEEGQSSEEAKTIVLSTASRRGRKKIPLKLLKVKKKSHPQVRKTKVYGINSMGPYSTLSFIKFSPRATLISLAVGFFR